MWDKEDCYQGSMEFLVVSTLTENKWVKDMETQSFGEKKTRTGVWPKMNTFESLMSIDDTLKT